MGIEYYTSEQFIHDDLCTQAEAGVKRLYKVWKSSKKIDPFLVAWPSDPVTTEDGSYIDGPCVLELSDVDRKDWQAMMLETLKSTSAYAMLIAEQVDGAVKVILESQHGTRCWTLPIVKSGDTHVLGSAQVTNDQECLGLLWQRKRAEA